MFDTTAMNNRTVCFTLQTSERYYIMFILSIERVVQVLSLKYSIKFLIGFDLNAVIDLIVSILSSYV